MSTITELEKGKIIPIEVPTTNYLKSVNFYLVQKNRELFLIDAGYHHEAHWKVLNDVLSEHHFSIQDLTAILLTHHHIDHVGLVHMISKKYKIPVYIHPHSLPKLKVDPEFIYFSYHFFKNIYQKMDTGKFGEREIEARYKRQMENNLSALDWNVFPIEQKELFGFEIIDIPGHAQDQVGFYLPKEEIIFVGDLLINHLRTNAFVEPNLNGKSIPALQQHIESLEKIIALNPIFAFSGHGNVIKEPALLAKKRLEAIDSKMKSILLMIEQGISTGREIVMKRHPDKYEKIFATLMSDTLSFLEYMESKGLIRKNETNGIWKWVVNTSI